MRSFGTLFIAFLLSWFAAGALQVQLGVVFKADLELVVGMVALAVMTIATTFVLGIALGAARAIAGVDRTAGWLVTFTLAAVIAMVAIEPITKGTLSINRADLAIVTDIAMPIVVMIVIQWWLVRRRWLKKSAVKP